ncbi:RNA polymerase sigma factor [Paenibacillus aurantius]|uniref:RNA polymerase sigma factor n=1 Tax=Paenibacillus aurantius TaxID=2918900 RepID=A0AA96LDV1_9BACL|nr:RNA polymerase sigma factor [Paenibacillus aurantius]WNQ11962.1 RNA polymerase sigma factor [Paenibacillus aurantius]
MRPLQSDEQLIQEGKQGIESSMELLIKRHYRMVFAYIYRYTGDYHTSYDLTQETFCKMVRALGSRDKDKSFPSWLLKIALNTCRDHYRSGAFKAGQVSQEWEEGIADPNALLVDLIERKLENAVVRSAVMDLPPYQRETIILRYYHDLKIKDIADLTSAGESTVKSRIKQGLAKLKMLLERRSPDDRKKTSR